MTDQILMDGEPLKVGDEVYSLIGGIAEAAGQIIRRCGGDDTDGGTLYSENLY